MLIFWIADTAGISDHKRVLYEQVTYVKALVVVFSLHRVFAVVVVASDVALHRVCIRTLDELSWCKLGAGWGSRGESMLPFLGRSSKTKTRTQSSEHGVVATGKHVDLSSSLFVKRHIRLLRAPETVKQHGQLAGYCNNGLALGLLATSCG